MNRRAFLGTLAAVAAAAPSLTRRSRQRQALQVHPQLTATIDGKPVTVYMAPVGTRFPKLTEPVGPEWQRVS